MKNGWTWTAGPGRGARAALVLALLGMAECLYLKTLAEARFTRLEEGLDRLEERGRLAFEAQGRQISLEALALRRAVEDSAAVLDRSIRLEAGRTIRNIEDTKARVVRTEGVYGELLEEQKKKTLKALYGEDQLMAEGERARQLFRTGRYGEAEALYLKLSEVQPENLEARFYRYYALFLLNKGDRDRYRLIREGLLQLERLGYVRDEIGEALSYMAAEESLHL